MSDIDSGNKLKSDLSDYFVDFSGRQHVHEIINVESCFPISKNVSEI